MSKQLLQKMDLLEKKIFFLLMLYAGKEMTGAPNTEVGYITTQKNRRWNSLEQEALL